MKKSVMHQDESRIWKKRGAADWELRMGPLHPMVDQWALLRKRAMPGMGKGNSNQSSGSGPCFLESSANPGLTEDMVQEKRLDRIVPLQPEKSGSDAGRVVISCSAPPPEPEHPGQASYPGLNKQSVCKT
ncbi:hypothetical protein KKI24_08190 [bacterium]|nr:hypothetical protein [bacterium]